MGSLINNSNSKIMESQPSQLELPDGT